MLLRVILRWIRLLSWHWQAVDRRRHKRATSLLFSSSQSSSHSWLAPWVQRWNFHALTCSASLRACRLLVSTCTWNAYVEVKDLLLSARQTATQYTQVLPKVDVFLQMLLEDLSLQAQTNSEQVEDYINLCMSLDSAVANYGDKAISCGQVSSIYLALTLTPNRPRS